MKKFAKALGLIACAAAFCVCALAACSSSNGSATSSSTSSGEADTTLTVELQVSADSAFSRALLEIEQLYSETHEGVSFAEPQFSQTEQSSSKGVVASTVSKADGDSAHADIVIAGSKAKMNALEQEGAIQASTRFDLARNRLVIVAASDNDSVTVCTLSDIVNGLHFVALGDADVASGVSAREALSTAGGYAFQNGGSASDPSSEAGSYSGALAEPGVVTESPTTSAVCENVRKGVCDVALVYATDVYRYGSLKIVGAVDASAYAAVDYPVAVSQDSEHMDEAEAFLSWCATSADAREILQKWGFAL